MSTEQTLTLAREPLLEALGMLRAGVERRNTLPILGHVLLEQDGDTLSLTASNLETEITTRISIVSGRIEPITLPAGTLYEIVRLLPAESALRLTLDHGYAVIKQGRSRFKLNPLPATDFPKQTIPADAPSLTMTELQLACLLTDVSQSMAVNDVRPYLNGVLLLLSDGKARAVATDGHRLSVSVEEVQLPNNTNAAPILPRHAVSVLRRIIGTSDSAVTVRWTDNVVAVHTARATVISKLIDGKYPQWEKVVAGKGPMTARLNRAVWLEALRRARVVTDGAAPAVALHFRKGEVGMVTRNQHQESAEESVPMEYDGADIELGLNADYLIDALEGLDGDMVTVRLRDGVSVIHVLGDQDKSPLHVIMPLRL